MGVAGVAGCGHPNAGGRGSPFLRHLQPPAGMRMDVEAACRQGRLSLAEGKSLLKFYYDGLEGYTYLEG